MKEQAYLFHVISLFGEERIHLIKLELSACLISLFLSQHFPICIPLKVERALSNDVFEVYLARKKLLDWNVCPQIR